MKKASVAEDNNAHVQGKEGSKLNRSSMQLANRLDIQLRSVVEWEELFQPDAVTLRQRLRTQCEMLILNHPKEYGRRAEERLWRKVFYDVIQKLRNHRKILEEDSESLDAVLRTHLSSAAGYYYRLLTRLQFCYHLTLDALSWGFPSHQQAVDQDDQTDSWAIKACQRCLIYLGDIARYQSDLEGKGAIKLAERFYFEAALINPDIGMPQNQLGTLAGTRAYGCEAAYFYMRCLLSKEVFEGAEGNLLRIFEKNRSILYRIKELPLDEPQPKERLKRFLVYFLYLQDVLYQHDNSPDISSEDIGHLCQSVLQDFSSVLSVDPSSSSTNKTAMENGLAPQENGHQDRDVTDDTDGVISSSLMVKLVVMAIATVNRLQSKGSQESSVATAFTLAFLSLLLQNCISSFENFLTKEHSNSEPIVANGPQNTPLAQNGLSVEKLLKHENSAMGSKPQSDFNKTKKLKKVLKHRRRRRRRRNIDYSFESYSGSGSDFDESGDEDDEDSDLSEGGGEVDGVLDDLMSDDSDDVYIESESDNESGNTGSLPRTVFQSAANGKQFENYTLPKYKDKISAHHAVHGKHGLKAGFLGQNGISVGRMFRPDLFSDVSDAETESSVASRAEILRDCVESNLLKAVAGQKLLPAIKVLTDWLRLNGELVMTCVESMSALWSRLASLLNMFPSAEQIMSAVPMPRWPTWRSVLDETLDENWDQTRGLPEDMSLLGLTPLTAIHSRLDRKWSRLTRDCQYLEAAVRIQCLKSFGMKLASTEVRQLFKLFLPQQAKPPKPNITKEMQDALKNLKQDDSIMILPADKGRASVVLNTDTYHEKMKTLIETGPYQLLSKDPTERLSRKLTDKLLNLKRGEHISETVYNKIRPRHKQPPRIYGLPKIHKTDIPLRPIVSCVNTFAYDLSAYLADILSPLTGKSDYAVANSTHFVSTISREKIQDNEVMVSFDVESLFTNVPIEGAEQATLRKLENDPGLADRTTLTPAQIVDLLNFVLRSTYFQYDGSIYEQKDGAAMGSPVSAVIANIYMEEFEEQAIATSPYKPKVWKRYVDDTFTILDQSNVDGFLQHLNNQQPTIRFTMETEKDNTIPFLDTSVTRDSNGLLTTSVYRKPTHTDQYLAYDSHHPQSVKRGIVKCLYDRAKHLITRPSVISNEKKHLSSVLVSNGYPSSFVQKITKTKGPTTKKESTQDFKSTAVLPYIKGVSEVLRRCLQQQGVRTVFKSDTTLRSHLVRPKDVLDSNKQDGVVYKIPCECGKVYIGETGRSMHERIKEHDRDIRLARTQTSAVSEHANKTGHFPIWDKVKFIDRDPHWYTRRVKEAIHIRLHPNNINRDSGIEIPEAWMPTIKKHNSRPISNRTGEGTTSFRNNNQDRNTPIATNQRAT